MHTSFRLGITGLFFVTALAAAGCGDELMSKGEYCSAVGGPSCDRFVSCQLITSAERAECVSVFQTGCCGDDNSCGERAASKDEETLL
jgi:hypothetical protein